MRQLTTLGTLALADSTLSQTKLLVLLAFLCLEGPTPRRRLHELFWPGAKQPAASLRVALHTLRERAGEVVSGSDILEAQLDCDAARLLAELAPERVFSLYTGPFLHGVELPGVAGELQEWLVETAERVASAAQQAGFQAAELSRVPAQRARLAEALYRLPGAPPLTPGDLRRLGELLAPGSPAERAVHAELAQFGGAGQPSSGGRAAAPATLLGRQRELSELLGLLGPLKARLIEVTGPGGIGKTTLVDAALREHAGLTGVRIASVDVETFQHPADVAAQLAGVLGLTLNDQGNVWSALAHALGPQPVVLALHGAEHLPALIGAAYEVLSRNAAAVMVLTSRVRRADSAHLHLEGLQLPPGGTLTSRDEALIRTSPAVQLFVREAQRGGAQLNTDGPDLRLIASVVRRLDGHPLAVALAASWAGRLPLGTLHDHLLRDAALMRGSEWHDLRTLFERSWSLLDTHDQHALSQLVVFNDFSPGDALAAVGVGSEEIAHLEAHSLLRRREDRWQVLPVLSPMVPGSGLQAAQAAHAHHYLSLLVQLAPEDPRLATERGNLTLAAEYAVRNGTAHADHTDALLTHYDRSGLLTAGAEVFGRLAELLPTHTDGNTAALRASVLIGQAWLALRSSRPRDAERLARRVLEDSGSLGAPERMKALNVLASALNMLGQTHDAIPYLREAAELARSTGDDAREARYLANLGTLVNNVGQLSEGERLLERAIELHQAGGREMQALTARMQLLNVRVDQLAATPQPHTQGLLEEARFLVGELERRGAVQETCRALIACARLLLAGNEPQEALRLSQRTAERCRQQELTAFEAAAYLVSAQALYELGRTNEARSALTRGLTVSVEQDDVPGMIEGWLVGAADLADIQPTLAQELLLAAAHDPRASASQRARALQQARTTGSDPLQTGIKADAPALTARVLTALRR